MERVHFHDRRATLGELVGDMVDKRPPHVELEDADAVQGLEVGERKLDEGPLVAFEILEHTTHRVVRNSGSIRRNEVDLHG